MALFIKILKQIFHNSLYDIKNQNLLYIMISEYLSHDRVTHDFNKDLHVLSS